ncbi:LarC family nickel insertion protein [Desulfoscipio gibsoniae]|uniref:TIGR00299 family protein n=1 Tax=Desulfoscipio gibsoniae DSM 7213 TaxID=767817 RepID=R4KGM3_9FIRM|nr:LarC family nickel insertion protein [Desulfoscipio gibsoniae]AGL00812.1 hypothetical protein Desgi_1304 [Desulfoscipio gibsoniae DSM 7213]
MQTAYFDCFSGVSGDMCLGALVGAGVDLDQLRQGLAGLAVEGYVLRREQVCRAGIAAENILVDVSAEKQLVRHLSDIERIIDTSDLPEAVKYQSKQVFKTLAGAEARVHGTTPDKIHFHEVGAVDAIVDVVGTVLGLHLLGVQTVYVSPLPLGSGFIHCRHGIIPSPAPATLEILTGGGIPIYDAGLSMETVTPTGSALMATLSAGRVGMPTMTIERVGYGAGKREYDRPNLLRLIVGGAVEPNAGCNKHLENKNCHHTSDVLNSDYHEK